MLENSQALVELMELISLAITKADNTQQHSEAAMLAHAHCIVSDSVLLNDH